MRNFFSWLFFMLLTISVYAQRLGVIHNFSNRILQSYQINFVEQDRWRNILLAADNALIVYDSYDWKLFRINDEILDVVNVGDSTYLIGEDSIFVFDGKTKSLNFLFKLDGPRGRYWNSVVFDDRVVLVFDSSVVEIGNDLKIKKIQDLRVSGGLKYKENLLLYVPEFGLFNVLGETVFDLYDKAEFLIFSIDLDSAIILGLDNNLVYKIVDSRIERLKLDCQPYLKKHLLLDAKKLNDSIIVIATQTGGLILYDIKNEKTLYLLTNLSGLPDNEVYAFEVDDNNNLWIVHSFGLSFLDLKLDIRNLSAYSGLQGYVTYAIPYKSTIYVGTTEGVFYLTRPSSSELIKLIQVKQSEKQEKQFESKAAKKTTIFTKFTSLFKRKKKQTIKPAETELAKSKSLKTKRVILDSALYFQNQFTLIYRKVQKINSKVKLLFEFNNQLVAVTTNGLYIIKDGQAKQVFNSKYIYDIDYDYRIAILSYEGLTILDKNFNKYPIKNFPQDRDYNQVLINDDTVYIASENIVIKGTLENAAFIQSKTYTFDQNINLFKINSQIYFASANKLYKEQHSNITIVKNLNNAIFFEQTKFGFWFIDSNFTSLSSIPLSKDLQLFIKQLAPIRQILTFEKYTLVINKHNQIFTIYNNSTLPQLNFFCYTNVSKHKIIPFSALNSLTISIKAPCYYNNQLYYRYGYSSENDTIVIWTQWKHYNEFTPVLNPGSYKIYLQAKNIFGQTTKPYTFNLTIKPPFTQTIWFYLLLVIGTGIFIGAGFYWRQLQLQKRNRLLEQLVRERTAQIEAQKEELKRQRDEIAKKNQLLMQKNAQIQRQYEQIAQLHKELTDSIQYARRIQQAILPSTAILGKYFSDYFLIYLPRDVVSGDFYWFKEKNGKLIVVVADCTGHGVPGAFLTVMGIAFLNEIVIQMSDKIEPGEILNRLRDRVLQTLSSSENGVMSDGMDLSLIVYDKDKKIVKFAGAYNPIYVIHDGALVEIKAQRMPIGRHPIKKQLEPFETKAIKVEKGDIIYMFTDGFQDQFGNGEKIRKFSKVNFKKLLTYVADFEMFEQKQLIIDAFNQWKGDNRQTDDITILGLKI